MPEIIVFLAVLGSAAAGLWDLKTTEVPDEIPALMIVAGILYWFVSGVSTGDAQPFLVSVVSSAFIGAAGYALYKAGKWGGADAFIFSAIAAMVPVYNGRLFILDYAMNFIIVSGAYLLLYTAAIGVMNPSVFSYFRKDLKKTWLYVLAVPAVYFPAIYLAGAVNSLTIFYGALLAFLVFFWRYAFVIEEKIFKKKIAVSRLKPGDVLEKMVWRGLTAEEIKEIKRKEKYVTVKEGVRFVPAFAINLVITLLYGNILLMVFGL
ncbi:MAG: prepilin peptidase [Candidatus Aenigmarchaeota archaeon]|nr:prepilin peptidase [Candidatus Aenigmarchaeota archaeon]